MKTFCLSLVLLCMSGSRADAQASMAIADSLYAYQDWKAAAIEYEKAFAAGDTPTALTANKLGFSYLSLHNYPAAVQYLERSLRERPAPAVLYIVMSRLARAYAGNGEKQQMYTALDSAVANGYVNIDEMDSAAEYAPYRHEPGFESRLAAVTDKVYPCLKNARQREFDFWVGDWDVYQTGTNRLVGHSSIQVISGGCSILENWTALGYPSSGKSMNFVDPATGKWKQVWVGSGGGVTEYINGEYRDSAMQFESTTQTPQGTAKVRFRFFNQGPGQVRQFQEYTQDDGKTWNVSYDLTYIRRKG